MGETKRIPRHLQKYVVQQYYEKYTPINQAVWRYVMRQNHNFLKDAAHEAYVDGLTSSGISIEKIPNIMEMNEALAPQDWGTANISGFIPGVVFFEFQANGILPIASDIRKLEHIQYTPAPDIIHEAAGHAPILLDPKFSEYVKLFGQIGSKAIATKEEHELFDAIRDYSDILERGESTEEQIAAAKELFDVRLEAVTELSEAEQISRLYWWTVEYGLIGSVEEPKIYGAGLLSSVAEGRSSLLPETKKLPFDLETMINTGYDITKPQPQLFVCESFDQCIDAVNQFAERMAFRVGGTESLDKALHSDHTATFCFSSGLQLTGTLETIIKDAHGEAIYIKTKDASALAFENKQLEGHGKETHFHGFSSPIGKLKNTNKPLEDLSNEELTQLGIIIGNEAHLEFESGVSVKGVPTEFRRGGDQLLFISFSNCTVTYNGVVLFESSWGTYDMAVGERITSVFAGAADSEVYYADLEEVEAKPPAHCELTALEQLYGKVRALRETFTDSASLEIGLVEVIDQLSSDFPEDWLLRVEVMELLTKHQLLPEKQTLLLAQLEKIKNLHEEYPVLIDRGLKLVNY